MIALEGATLVGQGCRRLVYVHPDHPDRCIKVQTPEARSLPHRQKALVREIRYLRFYERHGRAMDQVSRYFGAVPTSAGEGHVFELVRDADGTVSPALARCLAQAVLRVEDCRTELQALRDYLMREGIIVADLHAGNLAWQDLGAGRHRLVVIDGIGNTEFLKVNDYLRAAARRKVRRKWDRFLAGLATSHAPAPKHA